MSIYNQILENKLKELAKGGSAVAKQELLIQQKKREIEAKLAEKAKKAQSTAVGLSAGPSRKAQTPLPHKSRFDLPPTPVPIIPTSDALLAGKVNNFKNDGSFLEHFQRLQNVKGTASQQASGGVKVKAESQDNSNSNSSHGFGGQQIKTERPENGTGTSQPTGLVIKLQAPQPVKTLQPSAVAAKLKGDDDDDDEEEEAVDTKVSSPEGKAVQGAIERVAICVAINGLSAEEAARAAHADDPAYGYGTPIQWQLGVVQFKFCKWEMHSDDPTD